MGAASKFLVMAGEVEFDHGRSVIKEPEWPGSSFLDFLIHGKWSVLLESQNIIVLPYQYYHSGNHVT